MELMHFLDISNFNSICVCSLFTVTISLFFLSIILLFTGCAGGQSADVDDVKIALIILGCESAEVTGIAPEAYLVPLVIVTKQDGETKRCLSRYAGTGREHPSGFPEWCSLWSQRHFIFHRICFGVCGKTACGRADTYAGGANWENHRRGGSLWRTSATINRIMKDTKKDVGITWCVGLHLFHYIFNDFLLQPFFRLISCKIICISCSDVKVVR